jgi:hypothetical protein
MQEKTIKGVLRKKFSDWISSIEDESVRKLAEENTIITGGAIVSLMQNEQPNDYDIYFRTKEVTRKVAEYYANKYNEEHGPTERKIGGKIKIFVIDGEMFDIVDDVILFNDEKLKKHLGLKSDTFPIGKYDCEDGVQLGMTRMITNTPKDRIKIFISSDGVVGDPEKLKDQNYYDDAHSEQKAYKEALDDADSMDAEELEKDVKKYRPVFFSSNAITLSNKVQIVVRFYGNPDEIHESYDFVHTKNYWTSWNNYISIPKDVYECVMNKTLKYTGSKYPICSLFRLRKFIKRGWNISAGEVVKISFQISELDLTDIDILEEQLIGVDSLYFMRLVDQLRLKKEKDPNWEITQNYVISIIDKVFG